METAKPSAKHVVVGVVSVHGGRTLTSRALASPAGSDQKAAAHVVRAYSPMPADADNDDDLSDPTLHVRRDSLVRRTSSAPQAPDVELMTQSSRLARKFGVPIASMHAKQSREHARRRRHASKRILSDGEAPRDGSSGRFFSARTAWRRALASVSLGVRMRARPRYMIHPDSWGRRRLDAFVGALILLTLIEVPFAMAFGVERAGAWGVYYALVEAVFALEIVANFRTMVYQESHLIFDPCAVAYHYIFVSKWFWPVVILQSTFLDWTCCSSQPSSSQPMSWILIPRVSRDVALPFYDRIDFPAVIPFGPILDAAYSGGDGDGADGAAAAASVPKLLKLVRLVKVLRMLKLLKLLDAWDQAGTRGAALRLCKSLLVVVFLCHTSCCVWHLSATACAPEDVVERGFCARSWVVRYGYEAAPTAERYLVALYWAGMTITTVGYGDVSATTPVEQATALLSMLGGALFFAYMVGSITTLVGEMNVEDQLKRKKMCHVLEWMRFRGLSGPLVDRVKRHYEFQWRQVSVFDEAEILRELPEFLRHEITTELNEDLVDRVPFIGRMGADLAVCFCRALRPVSAAPGQRVIRQGCVGTTMYVVSRGVLDMRVAVCVQPRSDARSDAAEEADGPCGDDGHAAPHASVDRVARLLLPGGGRGNAPSKAQVAVTASAAAAEFATAPCSKSRLPRKSWFERYLGSEEKKKKKQMMEQPNDADGNADTDDVRLKILSTGDTFGHQNVLQSIAVEERLASATITAKTFANLFAVSRESFGGIAQHFPQLESETFAEFCEITGRKSDDKSAALNDE